MTDYKKNNIQPLYSINVDGSKWRILPQEEYRMSLLLFITSNCNIKCNNCFSISSRGHADMKLDDVTKILKANTKFEKVDLMGGEPLLHTEISKIIEEVRSQKRQVSIYTNGILLEKLSSNVEPIRICVSFSEIESNSLSRKPLKPIMNNLNNFYLRGNKVKLVFLTDEINAMRVEEIIEFVDLQLKWVATLTIGLIRYEPDYWNDYEAEVLAFSKYAEIVQYIINNYDGRLNLDIFTKGVLDFPNDIGYVLNRTNRFKCVFPDLTYSDCLFNACDHIHPILRDDYLLPSSFSTCKHTGKVSCLADKVRLVRV